MKELCSPKLGSLALSLTTFLPLHAQQLAVDCYVVDPESGSPKAGRLALNDSDDTYPIVAPNSADLPVTEKPVIQRGRDVYIARSFHWSVAVSDLLNTRGPAGFAHVTGVFY